MPVPKGRRQIAKLSKRQLGFEFGRNILNQISSIANGIRDLVEKGHGIDQRTGQQANLECSPDDIKRSWTPEQQAAVEEFIATWSIDPPEPPKPPKPPTAASERKRK